jgi:hypothetical protein
MIRNRGQLQYTDLADITDHAAFMDFQLHQDGKRKQEGESSKDGKKAKKDDHPSSSGSKKAESKKAKFRSRMAKREGALKTLQGLPPMDPKEKKKLFAEGKCLICKEKGHRAFSCPKNSNKEKQENKK